MLKIKDILVNKNEILYIESEITTYYILGEEQDKRFYLRIYFKNNDYVDVYFDDEEEQMKCFNSLVKKVESEE